MITCVAVLFIALMVAIWVGIKSANDARKALETLRATNDEAHRVETAKLMATPMPTTPKIVAVKPTQPKRVKMPVIEAPLNGPIPSTQLRQHVRALRKARGWNQEELARRLGMADASISAIETVATYALSHKTICKLATAFGEPIVVSYEPDTKAAAPIEIKAAPIKAKPAKHPKVCTCEECLNASDEISIELHDSDKDRLRDVVHAALNDFMCDEIAPPQIVYMNEQYCIRCELWGDAVLEYRVPKNEQLDKTVANILAKTAPLLRNPYSD